MSRQYQPGEREPRLLVAVDLHPSSIEVVRQAARMARAARARIWLLHVAPPEPEFVGYAVGPRSVRDAVAAKLRQRRRQLQQLARGLRALGIDAAAVMVRGDAVREILDRADSLAVDLIVIGAPHTGPLSSLLRGKVSSRLPHLSARPVLLVPSGSEVLEGAGVGGLALDPGLGRVVHGRVGR